jgi:hypothetical protein
MAYSLHSLSMDKPTAELQLVSSRELSQLVSFTIIAFAIIQDWTRRHDTNHPLAQARLPLSVPSLHASGTVGDTDTSTTCHQFR